MYLLLSQRNLIFMYKLQQHTMQTCRRSMNRSEEAYAARPMTPLAMQTLRNRRILCRIHLEHDGADRSTYK
jgi:hypothetical protein